MFWLRRNTFGVPGAFERDEPVVAGVAVDVPEVVLARLAEVVDVVRRHGDAPKLSERFAAPGEVGLVIVRIVPTAPRW
jgi:hypothetical protein